MKPPLERSGGGRKGVDTTTLTWEWNEGEMFEVHKSLDFDSWVVVEMLIPAAAATPSQTTNCRLYTSDAARETIG